MATHAAGNVSVSATLDGVTASTTLTVSAPELVSIDVTPASVSIPVGTTRQLAATGVFSDGSTQDLTTSATWEAAPAAVATINAGGLATGVALGSASVTATYNGLSGSTVVTVTAPALVSITVAPDAASVPLGLTQQFTATGTFSDNSSSNLTTQVGWSSSDTGVATISAPGLASTLAVGTTTIAATLGGISDSTTFTVAAPVITAITVTPADPNILEGRTQQFTATATLTDGSVQDMTAIAAWASTNAAVANVGAQGLATGGSPGSATISATHSGIAGTSTLTVRAAARLTKFAYVVNGQSHSVSAYTVDAEIGNLTPVPGSPFGTGISPASVTVDPSGRFVYVANFSGSSVSGYAVQANGALVSIIGSPFQAGTLPFFVAMAPSGRFAYVVNRGSGTVSVHLVDTVTGALSQVAGATVATGNTPLYATIHPAGNFLYVANALSGDISAYAIDQATGLLGPVPGSPFAAGTQPIQPVVDPSGRFLYVANEGSNVHGYAIDASTGALSPLVGSPFAAGSIPEGIQIDPTGRFVYVANFGSDNFSAFAIMTAQAPLRH